MRLSLLNKNLIKHHRSVLGITILLFLITIIFNSAFSLFQNANSYVNSEMRRTGYSDLNIWVSNVPKRKDISSRIKNLSVVKNVVTYPDIISNYETRGIQSDSEGVFLEYHAQQNWKFFEGDTNEFVKKPKFQRNFVYVPVSFKSIYGTRIGDSININLSRNKEDNYQVRVGGFFEDPALGSTMIGLKNILVSPEEFQILNKRINRLGRDTTARSGEMLRIFKNSNISNSNLNTLINQRTDVSNYLEYAYSATTLQGFMVILQQAFAGLLISFSLVLIVVAVLIISHTLRNSIEQEVREFGIYKALGFSNMELQLRELLTFIIPSIVGILLGLIALRPFVEYLKELNITTIGINFDIHFNWKIIFGYVFSVLILLILISIITTEQIVHISPLAGIKEEEQKVQNSKFNITNKHFVFTLAIKQILTNKKRYISATLVAMLLTFSLVFVGKINAWLGLTGQGMMDAFNPQDHDLGVQTFGRVPQSEIDRIINRYSKVSATYELAMPKLALNGVNYTANVTTSPTRFHILEGEAPIKSNEIVITKFLAADINKKIGDYVVIQNRGRTARYKISGFYQCANDMGSNFGMSKSGYLRIANDDPRIWCHHYFLERKGEKEAIFNYLYKKYGDQIHVHENTWPGLYGILNSMHTLILGMYVVVLIISLITVTLISQRILLQEEHDLALYKVLGYSQNLLRISYALRFILVSLLGSIVGMFIAIFATDPIAGKIMDIAGIADFHSNLNVVQSVIPIITITILFMLFAYLASNKIKRISLIKLLNR